MGLCAYKIKAKQFPGRRTLFHRECSSLKRSLCNLVKTHPQLLFSPYHSDGFHRAEGMMSQWLSVKQFYVRQQQCRSGEILSSSGLNQEEGGDGGQPRAALPTLLPYHRQTWPRPLGALPQGVLKCPPKCSLCFLEASANH